MKPRSVHNILQQTCVNFWNDDCLSMAAAIAFYTIFSLPPLLVIAVSVASLVFDPEVVQSLVAKETAYVVGLDGAQQIQTLLVNANQIENSGKSSVVGLLLLFFGATSVVGQLQSALNLVWQVKVDPRQSYIENFLWKRLFSLGMVVGVGFLLLVSLLVNTVMRAVGDRLTGLLPVGVFSRGLDLVDSASTLLLIAVMFAGMFRFLPDVRIAWRDVYLGSAVTSLLFVAGNTILSWYFSTQLIGSVYGAAGSLTLILVWVYYSSIIFLFGAELTNVTAVIHKTPVVPVPGAQLTIDKNEPSVMRETNDSRAG